MAAFLVVISTTYNLTKVIMPAIKSFLKPHRDTNKRLQKIKMRTHLNAGAMFATVRQDLERVPDHRANNITVPLVDSLMSGYAMFSLKDPSLLAFDQRRQKNPHSLHYSLRDRGHSLRQPDAGHQRRG